MTREEIIRMAREAGYGLSLSDMHAPALERFAALVAAAEREACATLAINQKNNVKIYHRLVYNLACQDILDLICARGEE